MEKTIEIPEGYKARIEGNKVIIEQKESEDEKVRKTLIHIVKGACDRYGIKYRGDKITEEKLLAYLERQKEQKPAEWSEVEQNVIDCAVDVLEKELPSLAASLKSLRPKPHWKPSEEQMGALNYAYCELFKRGDVKHNILGSLQNLIDTLRNL